MDLELLLLGEGPEDARGGTEILIGQFSGSDIRFDSVVSFLFLDLGRDFGIITSGERPEDAWGGTEILIE